MNDLSKDLMRDLMRDVTYICNRNNIPLIYQIFIQLGILFFACFVFYIYEECKNVRKKVVKRKKTKKYLYQN